jgi:TolB-like protein/Tfp pilus assembly protein PilF
LAERRALVADVRISREIVRFGPFELDGAAGELRKDGSRIRLQEQPLQVLQVLLEHAGRVVPREDLQRRIWPADTFVDFDHGINNAIKRLREALGDTSETPRYVETLPRRGYRFIGKSEPEGARLRSLAVLPLKNLSQDPEQEYFAEGLTEALITTLAKIGELRVTSRTSSMLYKGGCKPLNEIARELKVDVVVEGTVLREGDRIRVTAQLIDPIHDSHLWAESYERDLRNVLALQSEVAQAIAREVRIKLTPQERAQITQVLDVDANAYEAYLKGRYYWNRRSIESLGKCVECFRQAIAADPNYAAAYSGLADGLTISGLWSLLAPAEGCGKAKELAQYAIKLDPSLAEAHASLAWASASYDYNFAAAEREFERAIELNPKYATAHEWFGMLLAMLGRYEEAYTELLRAIRLDPCSPVMHWALGFVCWCWGRYDFAIEHCNRALELDSAFTPAYWQLGAIHLSQQMFGPAAASLKRADEISPDAPVIVALLAAVYAAAGHADFSETMDRLNTISKRRYVSPFLMGWIYSALDHQKALEWLERGYAERAEWMALLRTGSLFDRLRSEPGFQALLRRMNFPQIR